MFGVAHSFYAFVFLKSVGIGFITGVLWFVFALYRRIAGCGKIRTALLDVLFFMIAAVLSFLLLLDINAGVMRLYVFAGEGIGFCLFRFLPANAFMRTIITFKKKASRMLSAHKRKSDGERKNHKKIKKNKKKLLQEP